MKIVADLPKEILQILYKIDTDKIDKKQVENWLNLVKANYKHYFTDRKDTPSYVDHNLNLPKAMVDILNKIDFKINPLKRGMYLLAMKTWISNNLPLKRA